MNNQFASEDLFKKLEQIYGESQHNKNEKIKKILIPLFVIMVLLGSGIYGVIFYSSSPKLIAYKINKVDPIEERTLLRASGYVIARRAATVSSKITARIDEVFVEEGDKVQKGQLLAKLDDSYIRRNLELAVAQLEYAQHQLDEAKASLELSRLEYQRIKNLFQENVVSISEYDRARIEYEVWCRKVLTLEKALEVARREVDIWTQQLEDAYIRAPFSGLVTTKNANPGEMISPVTAGGGFTRTGICTIVDMDTLEIEIDVSEQYISRVYVGQEVVAWLDAYPEWSIPCHVIAIVPTADRQKSTIKVRVGFDKLDPRVLPEMSVRVAFLSDRKVDNEALNIPLQAVEFDGNNYWVWKIQNGIVRKLKLYILEVLADRLLVAAGDLTEGDMIVLKSSRRLSEGDKIKVTKVINE